MSSLIAPSPLGLCEQYAQLLGGKLGHGAAFGVCLRLFGTLHRDDARLAVEGVLEPGGEDADYARARRTSIVVAQTVSNERSLL